MDALIWSCSTGGGHNTAGIAVKEELERRGHKVDMFDPYELVNEDLARKVGDSYILLAQKTPHLFGFLYKLGQLYRKTPWHSPVYAVNKKMLPFAEQYLKNHHYDVIIMPHIYPGEILTYMKNKGISLPKLIFIATDYTCIPFTEEIDMDYYVIPSENLTDDFLSRGIPKEKILPLGIPVRRSFLDNKDKEEAAEGLGLDPKRDYILLSGGSIGAGNIHQTVRLLKKYLSKNSNSVLIVICAGNEKLYKKLLKKCKSHPQIVVIDHTDRMADYMKACSLFISKPGGLSSTEAAVMGVPLIHASPIPGCETKNVEFFNDLGMSIGIGSKLRKLPKALKQAQDTEFAYNMIAAQKREINPSSSSDICEFIESIV